ncbi:vWA domain-containing protein [Microcoleus anatoxicus]|uniref:VWA domain-containing protein n=1 Tax=Microcoleus anatoxicus PTRS2 TaxID=2705321 RepID=A0ABU8YNQ2_9CYAN
MPLDIEFAQNPEPRCPVVLLLDTSGSMSGDRIDELNAGLASFKQDVEKDTTASLRVEVAIITFDSSVNLIQDFVTMDNFYPPQLTTTGTTAMGEGIELALNEVESRKAIYKSNGIQYYQPWVFLITDGGPTDSWQSAAQRVRQADADRKISFYAIGVQGADMNILGQIAPVNIPPLMLKGLQFQELFRWLSDSMKRVSSSKVGGGQTSLPAVTGWAQTNT